MSDKKTTAALKNLGLTDREIEALCRVASEEEFDSVADMCAYILTTWTPSADPSEQNTGKESE